MRIAAMIACSGVLTFGMISVAAAETCDCPPTNAMSISSTLDPKWRAQWCSNQSVIDELWYGLNLDLTGDLWDEGWGYEDPCNDNLFLSRLFNAGFIIREVQAIAQHFPEPNSPNAGHKWWDFVHEKEDDGFEPKCCNANLTATPCCLWATHFDAAISTNLCLAWGFNRGAADRSSTLVHEATHEDESHISDNACLNGASCDTQYGAYNANTMEINYLYDAAAAYKIETVNNVKRRKVSLFMDLESCKQMCGYIPLLEEDERNTLLGSVKARLDNNFQLGAVFPNYIDADDIDKAKGTPWDCANCETSNYTFSVQTFGENQACNEITNHQNIGVNQDNRAACQEFNAKIGTTSDAAGYAQIKNELMVSLTPCQPCKEQHTKDYCAAQKATASTVGELDPYGILSSCGYSVESECLQSYCQEKFQKSWANQASNPSWDDPRGCLDAVCGNDTLCRKRYLTYGGDPVYYNPDSCTQVLLGCYEAQGKTFPGLAGSPGEIPECTYQYFLCMAKEAGKRKIMGRVLARKWVNPADPVTRQNPWEHSAQEVFLHQLAELKHQLDARTLSQAEFELEIEALMAHPESMATAFSLEPEVFVYLFGREGFESLVGPAIQTVKPRELGAADLDARGKILLEELRAKERVEGQE